MKALIMVYKHWVIIETLATGLSHNCMFEALWEICKRGEGLDGTVAHARAQANGNNVIVLINRDTASVLCGSSRRREISA